MYYNYNEVQTKLSYIFLLISYYNIYSNACYETLKIHWFCKEKAKLKKKKLGIKQFFEWCLELTY